MVKDNGKTTLLYNFDQFIIEVRRDPPDDYPAVLGLTAIYHNLVREWAEL
ncbi:hypothetical protein [Acetobacter sp.]